MVLSKTEERELRWLLGLHKEDLRILRKKEDEDRTERTRKADIAAKNSQDPLHKEHAELLQKYAELEKAFEEMKAKQEGGSS